MITSGHLHIPSLASKLIASFTSGTTTSIARTIADQIDGLDTYTWNTIIRGYLEGNAPEEAVLVYNHVRKKGLKVDAYTLLFVIKACGLRPVILEGEQIQGQIFKLGFEFEVIIQTALLTLYGLFGEHVGMQQIFDEMPHRDLVMWNALVAAYANGNCPLKVREVSYYMVSSNLKPNGKTAVSILSACSSLRSLREGKAIHGYVTKNLIEFDVFIHNALIDFYSKCGSVRDALQVFQLMPVRNVVSWTSLINGYSDNNCPNEALCLFKQMEAENIRPDEISLLGVVSMCTKLRSFELGEWIEGYVAKTRLIEKGPALSNALMDMHAKCGNIKRACQIFYGMEEKTIVSWTIIIQGLAMHGQGLAALVRFCQMEREGFKPDALVFLSLLSACSHGGLVDEGRRCFSSMEADYQIAPWMEHYGCMVDILCRAGLVNEAFKFVQDMPIKPDIIMWRTLIAACQTQGNISLANRVMNHLCELGPRKSEDYVLLSNLFALNAEWDNVEEVRKEMGEKGVTKQDPGSSFIER